MKLTREEIACIRSKGLYLTEKCDDCGKVLNQTLRYAIKDRPEVYCSLACRDRVLFGADYANRRARRAKVLTPRSCLHCGGKMDGKRADARFCSAACKMAFRRLPGNAKKGRILVTASPQNQLLTGP